MHSNRNIMSIVRVGIGTVQTVFLNEKLERFLTDLPPPLTRRYIDIDWARVRWRLPRTTVHSSHFKAIRCAWLHTKRLLCWVCWWWVITDKLSSTIRTDSDNLVSYWSGWGRQVESDLTWTYSWHRETSWKNKEEKNSLSKAASGCLSSQAWGSKKSAILVSCYFSARHVFFLVQRTHRFHPLARKTN